ncbi:MAG: MerR family transcriptional regulator [Eubacterium sp.]|nr:MerR family transcriptional regulator [Eubacterium sp.]
MSEVRYMISDAADKLGMEAHVLRYWEEELELEVPRNEMGHRYYTEEWLDTFRQIRLLKKQGYQLRAIKMLIHNPNQHKPEPFILDLEKNLLAFADSEEEASSTVLTKVTAHGGPVPSPFDVKLEQFQTMMTNIVKNALAENNKALGQAVSEHVGERVLKEMNYLMREREEQEEARFRKLDETLRSRQKALKPQRERRFGRKRQEKSLENIQKTQQMQQEKEQKASSESVLKKASKVLLSSWEEA